MESNAWKYSCGGPLDLEYEKKPLDFSSTAVSRNHSLWKYIDAMPIEKDDCWTEVLSYLLPWQKNLVWNV